MTNDLSVIYFQNSTSKDTIFTQQISFCRQNIDSFVFVNMYKSKMV